MHPLLTSFQRLALYVASWALIAALLAAAYSTASNAELTEAFVTVVPLCILYAFVCLSAWYICRAAPLRNRGILQILLTHLVSAALAATLWVVLWEAWTQLLSTYPAFENSRQRFHTQVPLIYAAGLLLFWLAAMFHYLLIAFETTRQVETRELGLEILAREAELKALRAQIDPHFLFNSLHSISALTNTDPAGARRMCLLLAEFFRNSVQLGAKDRITLAEELAMARQYLDIEKIRFGERLETSITLDSQCEACLVPPLILQPLVENSVRHGIHSLVNGGTIEIDARCGAGRLDLSVENPVDPETPVRSGSGVGLKNVKLRLRTLFGNEADAQVVPSGGHFRVDLRVPCTKA